MSCGRKGGRQGDVRERAVVGVAMELRAKKRGRKGVWKKTERGGGDVENASSEGGEKKEGIEVGRIYERSDL